MKKVKIGCIVIALMFVCLLALCVGCSSSISAVPSSAVLKEFDSKSWQDYKNLYGAHNKLMQAMTLYGEGKVTKLDMYNYSKDVKDYFASVSTKFNYGSSSYEKTYLSTFESWALADQQAAENIMRYLSSSDIKYLSTAKDNIKRASDAAVMIASNRSKLLKDAGYTSEEIKKIIDNITNELPK